MKSDKGNALVEFIGVVVALMIPAMYIATSCWTFVNSTLTLRNTAEAMARAYVVAPSDAVARKQVRALLVSSLSDSGIPSNQVTMRSSCSANPCLTAGEFISITLIRNVAISIPLLGTHSMAISQTQTAVVDELR